MGNYTIKKSDGTIVTQGTTSNNTFSYVFPKLPEELVNVEDLEYIVEYTDNNGCSSTEYVYQSYPYKHYVWQDILTCQNDTRFNFGLLSMNFDFNAFGELIPINLKENADYYRLEKQCGCIEGEQSTDYYDFTFDTSNCYIEHMDVGGTMQWYPEGTKSAATSAGHSQPLSCVLTTSNESLKITLYSSWNYNDLWAEFTVSKVNNGGKCSGYFPSGVPVLEQSYKIYGDYARDFEINIPNIGLTAGEGKNDQVYKTAFLLKMG